MFSMLAAKRSKSNLKKTIVRVMTEMARVTTTKNRLVTFTLGCKMA